MEIKLTEEDLETIEELKKGESSKIFTSNGMHSLNINITDQEKASAFILYFCSSKQKIDELSDTCGFTIESVNNLMAKDMGPVIDNLEQILDFLSSNKIHR